MQPSPAVLRNELFLTTALSLVAARVKIPYPTAMVIAGLLIGLAVYLIPDAGSFSIPLNPDVLFTLILPPLLYAAAWTTSWGEFRKNLRPIFLLAVGCVFFTMLGIAALAMAFIPGFTWPVAFALGAIVSPPDAVAATAVTERLRIPKRIITILDGESLVNDASALVALRFAITAIGGLSFSFTHILVQFPLVAGGGIAIGLALAWLFHQIHERLEQPIIETAITLLAPYACYISSPNAFMPRACWRWSPAAWSSRACPSSFFRPHAAQCHRGFWDFLTFMLNGLVFILIGLQLPTILRDLQVSLSQAIDWHCRRHDLRGDHHNFVSTLGRIPVAYLSRLIPSVRRHEPPLVAKNVFLISWIGMRGVVSLAAALALPGNPPPRPGAFPDLLGHPRYAGRPVLGPAGHYQTAPCRNRRA